MPDESDGSVEYTDFITIEETVVPSISFQTLFVQAYKIVVDS